MTVNFNLLSANDTFFSALVSSENLSAWSPALEVKINPEIVTILPAARV